MNREEVTLLGFEIVAYAGDARSKLLEALKAAEAGDFGFLFKILKKLSVFFLFEFINWDKAKRR